MLYCSYMYTCQVFIIFSLECFVSVILTHFKIWMRGNKDQKLFSNPTLIRHFQHLITKRSSPHGGPGNRHTPWPATPIVTESGTNEGSRRYYRQHKKENLKRKIAETANLGFEHSNTP